MKPEIHDGLTCPCVTGAPLSFLPGDTAWPLGQPFPLHSNAFRDKADARIRTADPFITSDGTADPGEPERPSELSGGAPSGLTSEVADGRAGFETGRGVRHRCTPGEPRRGR